MPCQGLPLASALGQKTTYEAPAASKMMKRRSVSVPRRIEKIPPCWGRVTIVLVVQTCGTVACVPCTTGLHTGYSADPVCVLCVTGLDRHSKSLSIGLYA